MEQQIDIPICCSFVLSLLAFKNKRKLEESYLSSGGIRMYCGNCGTQIDDSKKFCPNCGAMINAGEQPKVQAFDERKMTVVRKKRKILPFCIVLLIIIAGVLLCTQNTPEKVAIKACKTTLDGNMKAYYQLLSKPYRDNMVGAHGWFSTKEEFQKELLYFAENFQNEIRRSCGEKYKAQFEVIDTDKYENQRLTMLKSKLHRDYDYDVDKIADAVVVTVRITASGEDGISSWTKEESCVKINGRWYIHRPGF
ncbi:MAG: zinc-ribbon domain-containing protein [Oliverpabstia sp.]